MYLSFDLWTSPNKYAFLGIVCYFVDSRWKARIVLLGLKRLVASHAGVDMAQLVIHVISLYGLQHHLGYCVMDNAPDNNTALREISRWLVSTYSIE
jgi:hypothetical protein